MSIEPPFDSPPFVCAWCGADLEREDDGDAWCPTCLTHVPPPTSEVRP